MGCRGVASFGIIVSLGFIFLCSSFVVCSPRSTEYDQNKHALIGTVAGVASHAHVCEHFMVMFVAVVLFEFIEFVMCVSDVCDLNRVHLDMFQLVLICTYHFIFL